MKIALFGANGQLGADIHAVLENAGVDTIPCNHEKVDIADQKSVNNTICQVKPTHIINCAAMTNVPLCDTEKEKARVINVEGAKNVAVASQEVKAKLFHISTDYVFDGESRRPYTEEDETNPVNEYGRTKLQGERAVLSSCQDSVVLRVAAIYGAHPCRGKVGGQNFLDVIFSRLKEDGRVQVVDDEITTPTWTTAIARQVNELLATDITGVVHASSEGQCSWYEFACAAVAELKIPGIIEPVPSAVFPARVARPKYSVLENAILKKFSKNTFKPWQASLHEYLSSK